MKSKKYTKKKFENLVKTSLSMNGNMRETMRKRSKNKKFLFPNQPLKTVKFDKQKFMKMKNIFAWFGHSTILMKIDGKTIISDPVFRIPSPVTLVGPKPFPMTHPPKIEDLPDKIDLLLITHDHYDHLEKETIKKIQEKVKMFFVPLKVKKHLTRWGVPEKKVKEFHWYESKKYEGIEIIFTPSRHFSGRGLMNRNSTLWGGWIIKSNKNNIFISGDSGYFNEFKKIGEKYGPFDISFIDGGQYDKAWEGVHMNPEKAVQAGIELRSKTHFLIHWAKYVLSVHSWTEPIERFTKEAKRKNQIISTPKIGEIFKIENLRNNKWWK